MAFNGSLSYPDGGRPSRIVAFASFLSLVFSSAAPLFLKPAPSASVRRPVYPGIPSSRLSAANKAKWKSKQARNPTTGSDSGLLLFQLIRLAESCCAPCDMILHSIL